MAGLGRQALAIGGQGVAGHHGAGRQLQGLGRAQAEVAALLADVVPAAIGPVVGGVVDLVHARIDHGDEVGAAVLHARLLGHGQQAVHGQHGHAGGKGQALGHGARRAQARERARTPAEDDGPQLGELQSGLGHEGQDGGDQLGRGLRAAGAAVFPDGIAALHGDGEGVGTGV
ncbi:hypothetical protein GY15_02600 [Delftia sp. 670]|nr:hypothetical protein GY14_00060 [Delftia tsuruhatensis]KEH14694.1 hypothetical protein GY15_02600 [Delftia sp. 670]